MCRETTHQFSYAEKVGLLNLANQTGTDVQQGDVHSTS